MMTKQDSPKTESAYSFSQSNRRFEKKWQQRLSTYNVLRCHHHFRYSLEHGYWIQTVAFVIPVNIVNFAEPDVYAWLLKFRGSYLPAVRGQAYTFTLLSNTNRLVR